MTIDLKVLLVRAGLTEDEAASSSQTEAQYFFHQIDDGTYVHVEICAPNLAETITRLPVYNQGRLFAELAGLVPNIGDQEIVSDNKRGKREARVIRMKDHSDYTISLLLTR